MTAETWTTTPPSEPGWTLVIAAVVLFALAGVVVLVTRYWDR